MVSASPAAHENWAARCRSARPNTRSPFVGVWSSCCPTLDYVVFKGNTFSGAKRNRRGGSEEYGGGRKQRRYEALGSACERVGLRAGLLFPFPNEDPPPRCTTKPILPRVNYTSDCVTTTSPHY